MMNKKIITGLFILVVAVTTFAANVFASFSDIKGHWAETTIKWAESKGIAGGYPDGTFKPNRSVSEAEFLALLIRAYDPSDIIEIKNKVHWADNEYAYAMKKNYPTEGLTFIPKRNIPISRESVAEIIAGTQGVNYSGRDAIHFLLGKGLAKGRSGVISIEGYEGEGTLTRAEAVAFIKNVLEKGVKDNEGNPVIKPRPQQPSLKDELPPLPDVPIQPKPTPSPTQPSVPIGSVVGKELFDKTKDYAKELGYVVTGFVNTTGRFSEGEGITAGVYFTHYPGYENGNATTFVVRDWKNTNDVKLFKHALENYGVDPSIAIKAIDSLEVNSGAKIEAQGKVISVNKRDKKGYHTVAFTVGDW